MRLFIAEKPSVMRAIAEGLGVTAKGDGFIRCGQDVVTSCRGHMFEQAEPDRYLPDNIPRNAKGNKVWREQDLPIVPQRWLIEPKSDTRAQLRVIKDLVKQASVVVNAGDPDREGQLLVDEVLTEFGFKGQVLRFWASAQDAVSVKRALSDLRPNEKYLPMGFAAMARSRADWLIGMNLTRAFTLRAQRSGVRALLSVGRVQTPTLAMVVARDLEIENFKPKGYFVLQALIQHPKGNFIATWRAPEGFKGLDEEGRLIDVTVADALVRAATGQMGSIADYRVEAKADQHPRCFSLTDITAKASKRFGLSADEVLKICQSLYEEHKLTSYPRTDCGWLPEAQHADAPQVLAALKRNCPQWAGIIDKANPQVNSKTWNDSKVTAHHGIIPTMHSGDVSRLSDKERGVYEMIVRQYVAQFYPLHEYMATSVTAAVAGHAWVASGKTVTKMGWRELFSAPPRAAGAPGAAASAAGADDDEDAGKDADGASQALPPMAKGDPVRCARVERKDRQTAPPPRYDEGSLMQAMENIHLTVTDPKEKQLLREGDGIGTPATRSSIIKELKARTFLEDRREGKRKVIVSSQMGRSFLGALPSPVRSPALTALFERNMKEIEAGRLQVDAFVAQQINFVTKMVQQANEGAAAIPGLTGESGSTASAVGPQCPKCNQGQLRLLPPKPGKAKVWGCSAWQSGCKAFFDDKGGKPDLAPKKVYGCPTCKQGELRLLPPKPQKQPVWGCSNWQAGCKSFFNDAGGQPDLTPKVTVPCPVCSQGQLHRRQGGRSGYFWGCDRYREGCKGIFNDVSGKPDMATSLLGR